MKHRLQVEPEGRTLYVDSGSNLLDALQAAGLTIESTCGGHGRCGKCKVIITAGEDGERQEVLSCLTKVHGDMQVELQEASGFVDRKSGLYNDLNLHPQTSIKKLYVTMPKPSLEDQRGDLDRIYDTAGLAGETPLAVLRKAPALIRKNGYAVTVVVDEDRIIDIEGGDTTQFLFGAAYDIGTTTVVCSLYDFSKGEVVATISATNPQRQHGGDVISRITFASEKEENLKLLQQEITGCLNELLSEACKKAGIKRDYVYSATIVGNTCMHHLFLGLSPRQLALAPYIPVVQAPVEVLAGEIGLGINSRAKVRVLPNIAGFVGADTVGVIVATYLENAQVPTLAIDLGTNGEIVLNSGRKLVACSTAAGPAFEGAQITFGMRAAPGAIEKVELKGSFRAQVIGQEKIKGICGSGLIDLIAKLVALGVIEPGGRIKAPEQLPAAAAFLKDRLVLNGQSYDFIMATAEESAQQEPVLLTQRDVRELQLAKGAIQAGVKILLKEAGLTIEDLQQVLLAGAFGNYIDVESALGIGLLPDIPAAKIKPVGNAAGLGSLMALVSNEERARAAKVAKQVDYVELSSRRDFQEEFITSLNFPAP